MSRLFITKKDQKILIYSMSWLVRETYSFIERPRLSDADSQALLQLLQGFEAYDPDSPEVTISEGEGKSGTERPYRRLPHGSFALLKLAVKSFLDQVGPVPREFQIITGLPLADGESLLSRLQAAQPQAESYS